MKKVIEQLLDNGKTPEEIAKILKCRVAFVEAIKGDKECREGKPLLSHNEVFGKAKERR